MISTLHIKNIGIIDDITINIENGFNCLTGEAGAGKSLVIDSIGLLCGNRFSKEIIRKGTNLAIVEASIFNSNMNQLVEENFIVSREMFFNGRNICKINGRLVTVNELRNFMSKFIDIHSQHENQNLMDINNHIKYLDDFIGEDIKFIQNKYKDLYLQYNNLKIELKNNYSDEKEKQRELDLLEYQLNEIDGADLKNEEDEKLEVQRKQMSNQEKIKENLSFIQEQLENSIIDSLDMAIRSFEKIENFSEEYKKSLISLKSAFYDIEEIERDVYNYEQNLEFDSFSMQDIEERLDLINNLKRKYGNTIQEICDYKEKIKCKIEQIKNSEEINIKLKKRLSKIKLEMSSLANQMHKLREHSAELLSQDINSELSSLEMNNAKCKIQINTIDDKFNENGIDKVEFLICTNVGEEFKSLSKTASGGELSRIMLAIKAVLTEVDEIETIIFDEIDTGISGVAAKAVSEKMKKISKKHQIFVVTHLAVIAASSQFNLFAYKEVINNQTITKIKSLENEEFIKEIARISSGNISKISLEHAKELIQNSKVA